MSPFSDKSIPLCIDQDQTLIAEDVTLLSVYKMLKSGFIGWLRCFVWFLQGRAYLKHRIEAHYSVDVTQLTYNQDLIRYIKFERQRGRRVLLVTAADETVALRVAAYLEIFDEVIASDGVTNKRAQAKAQAIQELLKGQRFIYAGNSRDDLKVWSHPQAVAIIAVNCKSQVLKKALKTGKPIKIFPSL